MKKVLLFMLSGILALGLVSCNKDETDDDGQPDTQTTMGTFGEGIYKPTYKITSVKQGSTDIQTWTWGTSKLSSINDLENNFVYTFNYSGDLLGNVTIQGADQSILYTYGGTLLTKVEIVNGSRVDVTMNVTHDANDRISAIDLVFSDEYLVSLAGTLLSASSSSLSQVISKSSYEGIVAMAKIMPKSKNGSKYSISNKHFAITYTWSGNNLVREVLTGNVSAMATMSDVAEVFDMGSIAPYIGLLGNDAFPLTCTVSRTTNYTYDSKHNPFYCFWGDGINASNLSQNNLISAVATGAADASMTITLPETIPFVGGMQYPYNRTIDLGGSETHTYTYNTHDLPATITTEGITRTFVYSSK